MKKQLVIFGVGELGQLAQFYFSNDSDYEVVAFTVDRAYVTESEYLGLPLVPFDELKKTYPPAEYELYVAIGYTKLNENRIKKYYEAKSKGYSLASYVSSKSSQWKDLKVGENTFIMEGNTIMPF
ncbi:transferase, partial [Bacteroidota bacterium]